MSIGNEGFTPGLSEQETQTMKTIRHSPVEWNDLIVNQEAMLASEPDNFFYQSALKGFNLRWKEMFARERIPLSYPDTVRMYAYEGTNPDKVAQLLGPTGLTILGRIAGLINVAAVERKWPLEALEVHRQTDPEFDPKNILVVLRLRTASFDEADKILESFYPKLQIFSDIR